MSTLTDAIAAAQAALSAAPSAVSALQNLNTAIGVGSAAANEASVLLARYESAINAGNQSSADMAITMLATVSNLPSGVPLLVNELSNPAISGNAVAREQLVLQIKQLLAGSSTGIGGALSSIL